MTITIVPVLVMIIGFVMYILASNAKVVEVSRAMFWCGLLVTLFTLATHTVRIG